MKSNKNHKLFYTTLLFCILFITGVQAQKNDPSRYATESALAKGDWVKIKVEDNGFYKITYENLKQWGISNPKNVQIYGYGGWMLDQDFSSSYLKNQDDLPQVAVWMSKDRSEFGAGDYILFYGKGSLRWTYESSTGKFIQTQNPYSDDSYYFITESDAGPLLMDKVTPTVTGANPVNVFDDYFLYEKDLVNIAQTGREYYGESFKSKQSQDFSVSLPGVVSTTPSVMDVNFIARPMTGSGAKVTVSLNGTAVDTKSISVIDISSSSGYYIKANSVSPTVSSTAFLENNVVNINYQPSATTDINSHLNYIRVNYQRTLKPYGAVTFFRTKEISPFVDFQIAEATNNLMVFDITNGEKPHVINGSLSGTTLSVKAENNEIKEYAMVDISKKISSPSYVGKVKNQNLHGLATKDMVIIVRESLVSKAKELALIHQQNSGLETIVVTAEDIYNEFSSGKPDVTAYKRFIKMFYDRGGGVENGGIKYLLLFGDGTYDNKLKGTTLSESAKKSMLLTYQTIQSITELSSFTTDDYIGFLNDNDYFKDSSMNQNKLNLSIGRLPIGSESDANVILSKIKSYIEDADKGMWKNNIGFVADDLVASVNKVDPGSEKNHFEYTEKYTKTINKNYPEFVVNKIYFDSYKRSITSSGGAYEDVTKLLLDKLESGLLLLNYVGHGSTQYWSHENVLSYPTIKKLSNKRLPVVITATCDFGRFDNDNESGAEAFFLNANGGSIAMFTTVRVVYGYSNDKLNSEFINDIFKKEDNKPMRLGDIIRNAKNNLGSDDNKLRFTLLGDPALRLGIPEGTYQVKIKEVNGLDADSNIPQLKALSNNLIKGEIVDEDDNVFTDFNGTLDFVIYDSKQTLKTRGNDAKGGTYGDTYKLPYDDYTNMLYSGAVKVENGEFNIEFITSKDILYSDDYGKMSFLAYSDDSKYQAQGAYVDYIVGGMNEDAVEENNPPVIEKMYLNREDFASGEKVNSTPVFYAEVSDDTGINLSNGIGHSLSLTVDGVKTYDLRSSFATGADGQKSGSIKYVMPELEEGRHSLEFKVWDLWNNSTSASLNFEVVPNYKPVVYDFQILGNPAKEQTKFKFISDINGSAANVRYQVYNLMGVMVWTHTIEGTTNNEYVWDLIGTNGARLEPGIYICRMSVNVNGGAKVSKSQKLVIMKQ